MPIIGLNNSPDDVELVQSVMTFPTDQVMRVRRFTVYRVARELQGANGSDQVILDAATVGLLLDAPAIPDFRAQTQDVAKRGIVAGDILCTLFLMYKFDIPEPSIKKAIFVAQKYAKRKGVKYGDGTRLMTSGPKIREYWREFRSVAHLWAAQQLNKSYPVAGKDETVFSDSIFPKFLEVAATMLEFGTTFVPFRARPRAPIIEPTECWTLPDEIRPIPLTVTPPPDILLKTLRIYSAPKSMR